ncbi:MAG: heme biosynthesis protein HemY [Gammaproteobacteria bacterium WSBS_2016_MAG_OTU1]
MNTFRWIKNILFVAAVAALIAAANVYLDQPLYIRYGVWEIAPTAAVATATAVLIVIVLYLILRLLSFLLFLPTHIASWRQQRQQRGKNELLTDGIRSLVFGNHKNALKYFSKLSENKDESANCYTWLAALSAEKIGDNKKRHELLQLASASGEDIAAAAKAQLACEENHINEAFNILAAAGAPQSSPLLAKMYLNIASQCGKWAQALDAAYYMREKSPVDKWKQSVLDIACKGLKKINDTEQLSIFWKNSIRSEEQKQPLLLAEYIYALSRLGNDKLATENMERVEKITDKPPEILSLIAAIGTEKMCESAFTSAQTKEQLTNAPFLSAMALLAERLQLWGKARRYYQMANALRPDPRHVKALVELEQKIKVGDDIAA